MPATLLTLLVLVLVALALAVRPVAPQHATAVRRVAFGVAATFSVLVGAWIAAETISDPGGWAAVGLIAAWLVPIVVAGTLMWVWPDLGVRVGTALTGVLVLVCAWGAFAAGSWRSFEDAHGPVRTVAMFAVAASLGILGLKRPRAAGVLLLVATIAPLLLQAFATSGRHGPAASMAAVATPYVIAGALFLASTAGRSTGEPRPEERVGQSASGRSGSSAS